jgi:PAS domain S-box-containing protein
MTVDTDEWLQWLAMQGEMGARVAAFDWGSTPVGPISEWPSWLRAPVGLCLASRFPSSACLGEDLRLVYNDACRDIYGPSRFADALGRPNADVWPEVISQLGDVLVAVMRTAKPYFAQDRRLYLDRAVAGEEAFFTFAYAPIVDDRGVPRGVQSIFVETTGQLLAERRLRTVARLERELAGARTPDAFAEVTVDVLSDNIADHPAGAVFQVDADGGAPRMLASFGDPLDPVLAAELVTDCASSSDFRHHRDVHALPIAGSGSDRPGHVLLVVGSPSRPWDAALRTYLDLVAGSVTAAVLAQTEVRAERGRAARAEALDAAKSAFFAGVSHELRTPLALIAAPVEELLTDPGLAPEARRNLILVQTNADRLSRLVEAMLDFSRLEAGRVVPNLQLVELPAVLADLGAAFQPVMERAGLEFDLELAATCRPALVDRDFLERIILNLLSNAAKFTGSGSVLLRLVEDGDAYEVSVTDTGPGIALSDQDRVFSRFERLAAAPGAKPVQGAGIGLAMVRELTALLGGSVSLLSEPAQGSTFIVRLPFEPSLSVRVPGQSITPRRAASFLAEFDAWTPSGSDADPSRPLLLVVEDDAQLAGFLAGALADAYRVRVARDGAAGLAALRQEAHDLVLSDVSMPGMDGLGLIAEIRVDPGLRDIPVVLLTARVGEDSTAVGLAAGADDYIAKPFGMTDLRARLAANLERARERNQDATWRQAVLATIPDGVLIFDAEGLVLEANQALQDLLGFRFGEGPVRPPYPWWPTAQEDAAELQRIAAAHDGARDGVTGVHEFCFRTHDRRPVWVRVMDAPIRREGHGPSATLRVVRDISRERAAQRRRVAAAEISADFSTANDLESLLAVAETGFEILFDGGSTVQVSVGTQRMLFSGGMTVTAESLPDQVRDGLAAESEADLSGARPGILLVPHSTEWGCRAWVQFPQPRAIGVDEIIVADLLAQAFALAVDRVLLAQQAEHRELNLQQAVESHRLVGQAIGILVERHRLSPSAAFGRLRTASQNRNLKLREVARRVVETGLEPDEA